MEKSEIIKSFENKFYVVKELGDTIYLRTFNKFYLGRIEQYKNSSFICYYKAGNDNQKEHNLIIKNEYDIKILKTYLHESYDREFGGKWEIMSAIPEIFKNKAWWKTQKLYKK